MRQRLKIHRLVDAPPPPRRPLQHRRASDGSLAAQQVVDEFPDDTTPRWLLRDRDSIYGGAFRRRVASMGIVEIVCNPASLWQREIGSIRRECLDHVIVLSETHLRRLLSAYVAYYNQRRRHSTLGQISPAEFERRANEEGVDKGWLRGHATCTPQEIRAAQFPSELADPDPIDLSSGPPWRGGLLRLA